MKLHPLDNIMTELIDKSYFLQLRDANPQKICRKGRCSFSADKQQYSLQIWGNQYLIDLANENIGHILTNALQPHEYFDLMAVNYLLCPKDTLLSGEWISEKDLPGGSTFFRGPHRIPTDLISKRFNNDLQNFKNRCEQLGGTPIKMADAAFCFSITPDIPVAVLYWVGDEDFPAEAKILYDRSIIELLTLDILFALAVGVCAGVGTAVEEKDTESSLL
jgi:hypothetical protein